MSWNFTSSTASSERARKAGTGSTPALTFEGGGHARPLTIVRRASARGLRLAVDPRDATVRLTLSKRDRLKPALEWVAGKRGWVESELARLPAARPIVPGMTISLAGTDVVIEWTDDASRRVILRDGRLMTGGPVDRLGARVLRFLKSHALAVLDGETRMIAATAGLTVHGVGVGDPKGRWGSCSASGDIRYSWRLILAPDFVRRATVAHEVAHLVHMNHAPPFHALTATLNGCDPLPARHWLRTQGTALHWFGRED